MVAAALNEDGDPYVVLEPLTGGEVSLVVTSGAAFAQFAVGDLYDVYLSKSLTDDELRARVENWKARQAAPTQEPPTVYAS